MKILEGKIISIGMKNTVVVEVGRVKPHPLYGKLIRLSKKYKADNAGFEELIVGTGVKIQETRPISKQKHFKIIGLISNNEIKKLKTTSKEGKKKEVKVASKGK